VTDPIAPSRRHWRTDEKREFSWGARAHAANVRRERKPYARKIRRSTVAGTGVRVTAIDSGQRTIADNISWLIILPVCGNGDGADNRRKKEQSFKPRALPLLVEIEKSTTTLCARVNIRTSIKGVRCDSVREVTIGENTLAREHMRGSRARAFTNTAIESKTLVSECDGRLDTCAATAMYIRRKKRTQRTHKYLSCPLSWIPFRYHWNFE